MPRQLKWGSTRVTRYQNVRDGLLKLRREEMCKPTSSEGRTRSRDDDARGPRDDTVPALESLAIAATVLVSFFV